MANDHSCCCHDDHHHHAPYSGVLTGRLDGPTYRGYSNYELAVQNGFVGTIEDYLDSLKPVGIKTIRKVQSDGLVDTYAIILDSGDQIQYTVTNGSDGTPGLNGVGIAEIVLKQETDTGRIYSIILTNGVEHTFEVRDGRPLEMRESEGVLQYRVLGGNNWINLVDLRLIVSEVLPDAIDEIIVDKIEDEIDQQMADYSFIEIVDELPENPDPNKIYVLREEGNP